MKNLTTLIAGLALAFAGGCDSDDGGSAPNPGGGSGFTGVTQSGGQDFGLFRKILDAGEVPAPETLDDLGFFAEHKLDYPAPDCGADLCLHGLLGQRANFISGSDVTLLQLGMNSPIDVAELERPPLNLVLAIDTSGSMGGDPIETVRDGLAAMLDHLQPNDRISLVTYSETATIELEGLTLAQRSDLEKAFVKLVAAGSTNIYDGLFSAFSLAAAQAQEGYQNRVLLLSDGVATSGLKQPDKIVALAESYARLGYGLTTIGIGAEFDVGLMRALAEVGAGNFYFLEDPAAAREVFTDEVKTFLVPIALDVRISVSIGGGYALGAAYGTRGWSGGTAGGTIRIPSLFLAGRTDASAPIEEGRRGGGGAILLTLLPRPSYEGVEEPLLVGQVLMEWVDPVSHQPLSQQVLVESDHLPGDHPEEGSFSDATAEKAFVMLNLFRAFQMATELAADSDHGAARGVLDALAPRIEAWLAQNPDPDIQDDLSYVESFSDVLAQAEVETPVSTPPEPWFVLFD